jgi:hypothetical protein
VLIVFEKEILNDPTTYIGFDNFEVKLIKSKSSTLSVQNKLFYFILVILIFYNIV